MPWLDDWPRTISKSLQQAIQTGCNPLLNLRTDLPLRELADGLRALEYSFDNYCGCYEGVELPMPEIVVIAYVLRPLAVLVMALVRVLHCGDTITQERDGASGAGKRLTLKSPVIWHFKEFDHADNQLVVAAKKIAKL